MPLQLDRMAELDAALADGALLLMPNFRGSDQLVDQLCRYRRRLQPSALQPRPAIRAIDLWLRDLWEQLAMLHDGDMLHWQIMSPTEEQLLWQRLIRKTSPELVLLNEDGTASAAAEAWRLLQQWQVPLEQLRQQLALAGGEDEKDDREHAWHWLQAFDRHCRRHRLLGLSSMLQQLLQFVEDGTLARFGLLPPTVLLSGFDAPPPLYRALFAAMESQGIAVRTWHFTACEPALALQSCTTPVEECRAAARWAAGVHAHDPAAVIGILSADSNVLRSELERCCAQVFTSHPATFASTLAGTLAETPYVHAVLASLALLEDELETLACCALLRSPWLLAADTEADARAELELKLRASRAASVRCSELRELCLQQDKTWHSPQLGETLLEQRRQFLRQPRRQPLQAWLQFFETCRDALLPRTTLLQHGTRALVQGWEGLLKQAATAGTLHISCDFGEARTLLRRLCRATTLPTGRSQAAVLLLTPVNAAGLHFTHLWCMQMTEDLWPGEQPPHPYLPLQLQRQHGMPGADRSQALRQGRELLQDLVRRTTVELVFSHASSVDGLPQRATALLPPALPRRLSTQELSADGLHPAVALVGSALLERWQDSTCVPLSGSAPFQGGSGVLTNQSACPFKGFARYRLQARELPRPQPGIPAQALGDCVHEALRRFWQGMQDQATLLASTRDSLEQAVQRALEPALQALARLYPAVLSPRMQELETRRLGALLLQWLEYEKQRGPFSIVAAEQTLSWTLPDLELQLRVDRIDRLPDGSAVVVDYKTGKAATLRWDEDRPPAPQLLLYQQAVDTEGSFGETAALLYAGINVETPGYSGIAADDSIFPGLGYAGNSTLATTGWQDLKQRWQESIARLAGEFIDGYAAVQPARKDSCTQCHLGSLCRIAELQQGMDTEEEA